MSDSEEINKQVKAVEDLTSVQRLNLDLNRDINDVIREGLQGLKGQLDAKKSIRTALNEINKASELQVDFAKQGTKALQDSKKLNDTLAKSKASQNKLELNAFNLLSKARKIREDAEANIETLTVKQLHAMEAQAQASEAVAGDLLEQKANLEAGEESLASMAEASTQIANLPSSKLFSSLSSIAGAIPGVKNLTKGFDKAAEASKEAAASMVTINEDGIASSLTGLDKFKAGLKGLSAGVGELMKAFGPIAILGKVFQGMMKADKSAGEIAKGLNISTKEAGKLSAEMLKASRTSDELGVTYDGQKHALKAINAELGTSTSISAKTLATFSKMENLAGMTQEQMMGIGKLSFATGKDMEKMTGEFLAQAKSASLKRGVLLNEKKLMADISNVSAATTLSLGKNPKAIANAVATAKALGMEMSRVEGIANNLLDFESSIEKELEAELMLGKNINLEKARQAALNNDLATVASEIAEQAGSAADFAKMNRLQQEALADAVGMSREELAQTLFTQEQLKGLTEEEAVKAQEALDKRIEQVGLKQAQKEMEEGTLQNLFDQAAEQEKQALAAQQMNEAFMEMGKSLMPVLQTMTKIVTFAAENVKLIGTAIGLYGVINTLLLAQKLNAKGVTSEDKKQLLLGKSKLAQLAAQAVAFALANPITALIGLGVAAAVGAIAYSAMSKAGDINSPADGKTQISTKEGGLFELSPNDDIVAAPGASAALANASSGGGTSVSMQKLEQLQAQTNALLRQVLSTQGTVSLDAEKMGTAISMNTYEISP
jgi:hypothetical protein